MLTTGQMLISLCGIVTFSYLFTIAGRLIRIPSVILLLASAIVLRLISAWYNFFVIILTGIFMTAGMLLYKKKPEQLVEKGQFFERKDVV